MELLKLYFRWRSARQIEQRAAPATASSPSWRGVLQPQNQPATKVLIPVDGSRNSEFAVRHVVRQFMNNTAMEIHLLNVQQPLAATSRAS